ERGPNYLRVISPPVGSWRKIPRRFHIATIVLGLFVLVFFLLFVPGAGPDERMAGLINTTMYGIILLTVLAFAYNRVWQAFVFELTDQTFSLTRLSPWGTLSPRIWRRDAI